MARRRIYYPEFRKALESEPLRPVYLFTGAEEFLKDLGIQALLALSLEPSGRELNLEILYAGPEISGLEVKERALTLPFFADRRVLVVRQAEKWKPSDLANLQSYVERPSATTVLILSSQEERLATEAWKKLADQVYHVECYPLFESQLPAWVQGRFAEQGKRIEASAVNLLIELGNPNLADLENEIRKLADYTGSRDRITEEDVRESSGNLREGSLHELNSAVGRREAALAVTVVQRVLDQGLQPVQILGSLAWHMRNLRGWRKRMDDGENAENILSQVKNPQARREMAGQIRSFRQEEFERIFSQLLQLDEAIKLGKSHWGLRLQTTVWQICQVGKSAGALEKGRV